MARSSSTILICDDDQPTAELYASILEAAGWENLMVRTDPREVMPLLAEHEVTVILLDLYMPEITGKELLEQISAEYPEIPVLILTLEDNVDTAVECMKIGAFDFMSKPVDPNKLATSVGLAEQMRGLRTQVEILSRRKHSVSLKQPAIFESIITASDVMYRLFEYVEAIAPSPTAALITGESGTGKELFARAVHDSSGRAGRFIAVNVSGLDDTMFSDTLFGHVRGAYTGAETVRRGLIEQAAEGTLFLDEIGDLPMSSQVKLLRLLQEQEYYPLGSDTPMSSSARIVAATNTDLVEKQNDGSFRKDLYYRLMTHRIHLPALRERPDDIPVLLDHFLRQSAHTLSKEPPQVAASLYRELQRYSFPGNVRELQSLIMDAVSRTADGPLAMESIREYLDQHHGPGQHESTDERFSFVGPFPTLKEVESYFVALALDRAGGSQTAAAQMLGVSQSTLSRRLAADRESATHTPT